MSVDLRVTWTLIVFAALGAGAAHAKGAYDKRASLDEYLIADRNAEISLARSAAPSAISSAATILVLTRHGSEEARPDVSQRRCRALGAADANAVDRARARRADERGDARAHQAIDREPRVRPARDRRDVVHAVEGAISRRRRPTLASAPHVLHAGRDERVGV